MREFLERAMVVMFLAFFLTFFLILIFAPHPSLAISREEAKKNVFSLAPANMVDVPDVEKIFASRGFDIRLTSEERARFEKIPFSEETLRSAAIGRWRNVPAVLWWAPPERYGLTLRELRRIFGTNARKPPFFEASFSQEWWLREPFASEVVKEGWHLTTLKMPVQTLNEPLGIQKNMLAGNEELLSPVEIAFLMLVYFSKSGEPVLSEGWSRTNAIAGSGKNVTIGFYITGTGDGGSVALQEPKYSKSDIGALIGRKPE